MKRRSRHWAQAAALAAPAVLSLGAATQAQQTQDPSNPISAEVGLGYLVDGSGRDAGGSTGLHVGAGYSLTPTPFSAGTTGQGAVDLTYNHAAGNGGHVDAWGLTYTERVYFASGGNNMRPYVGAGLGVYHVDVGVRRSNTTTTTTTTSGSPGISGTPGPPVTTTSTTTTTSHQSGNSNNLGGRVVAGLDFGTTYVEASYDISGSAIGVRSDSLNLSVGAHF